MAGLGSMDRYNNLIKLKGPLMTQDYLYDNKKMPPAGARGLSCM